VGGNGAHLKVSVTQDGAGPFAGIGFGLGAQRERVEHGARFWAAFSLDENTWQGNTSLQLKIRDIRDEAP
jgi:single-stranded-DNA-specific exonuclease